jgi:hypothetical protein
MLIAMGIMGHFVGDAGQPYHNSANFNGQKDGHFGIHSYYESELVDEIPASLQSEVYASAKADPSGNIAKVLNEKDPDKSFSGDDYNVIARMRRLSAEAGDQMATITKRDAEAIAVEDAIRNHKPLDQGTFTPVPGYKKPFRPFADQVVNDKRFKDQYEGYDITDAFGSKVHQPGFHEMIVNEIGVSAEVLATFWGEILHKVDIKAQESGRRLLAALGDAELADVDARTNRFDFTKFYTTFNYPLDTAYIEPTFLIGGLSLKPDPLAPGVPAPPPVARPDSARSSDPAEDERVVDVVTAARWLWRHLKKL